MRRPLCILAVGLVLLLCLFGLERSKTEAACEEISGKVRLRGRICDKQLKTTEYGSYWQLTLRGEQVIQAEQNVNMEGNLLCQVTEYEEYDLCLGQMVILEGILSPWEETTNPGQFDLSVWYRSQGITGQLRNCRVLETGREFNIVLEKLWQLRQQGHRVLLRYLGEKNGSLVSAMILGEKDALDRESKKLYQRNGISHVLSISGLHVTLLGMGVFRILQRVTGSIAHSSVLSGGLMAVYCIFTGNSVSAVRATLMFCLSLLAKVLGRTYDSLSGLGLAAILILCYNPYAMQNSGFVLSFLAVIGVTYLAPRLQEVFGVQSGIGKALCVSAGATLMTLPVLLNNYGSCPWYGIFLNLFIVPPMPLLLVLPMGILGLDMLSVPELLPVLVSKLVGMLLGYVELCCKLFEKLPFEDGYLGASEGWQVMLYYVLLFGAVYGKRWQQKSVQKILLFVAIQILTARTGFGMEITTLDVGQGDSIVMRSESGKIYVSDSGSSSVRQVGSHRLLPFLKQKGYGQIEGIFLSHLDEDHANGIRQLLELAGEEGVKLRYLFLPVSLQWFPEDARKLEELLALASKAQIRVVWLGQGDCIRDGRMEITCLWPQRKTEELTKAERNNQSLVLSVSYGEFDLLLTGDIEKEGEEALISYIDRMSMTGKYELLKVAHHGSGGSSHREFLQKVLPRASILSVGRKNSYGHPKKETLERLAECGSVILDTREYGAITVYPKKNGDMRVEGFLKR